MIELILVLILSAVRHYINYGATFENANGVGFNFLPSLGAPKHANRQFYESLQLDINSAGKDQLDAIDGPTIVELISPGTDALTSSREFEKMLNALRSSDDASVKFVASKLGDDKFGRIFAYCLLRWAIAKHDIDIFIRLLAQYEVIPLEHTEDLIIVAAMEAGPAFVWALLAYTALDITANDRRALRWAIMHDYTDIATILMNAENFLAATEFAIQWAIREENAEFLLRILNIERVNPAVNDNSALLWAYTIERFDIVKLLVSFPSVQVGLAKHSHSQYNLLLWALENGMCIRKSDW